MMPVLKIILIVSVFFCQFGYAFGQSSCSGFDYVVDKEQKIPEGFVYKHTLVIDAKGKPQATIKSAYVANTKDEINLVIYERCSDTLSIDFQIVGRDGEVYLKNENQRKNISFTFPKTGIFYFVFTFKDDRCSNCAIVKVNEKRYNKF